MIDLDETEKVHKGWLEARVPCSPGQRSDSTTILELVEEIKRLRSEVDAWEKKKIHQAMCCVENENELKRTRKLLEESEKLIKAQDRILAAYRLGGNPGNAPQVAMKARVKLAKLRSVSPQGAPAGGSEG